MLESWYADSKLTTWVVQVHNYGEQAASYHVSASGLSEIPAGVALALAYRQSAATSQSLDETGIVSGFSIGNSGRAVQLDFSCAAEGKDLRAIMVFRPSNPFFCAAFGFIVHGSTGAAVAVDQPTVSAGELVAEFASAIAGEYGILVYN